MALEPSLQHSGEVDDNKDNVYGAPPPKQRRIEENNPLQ